MQYQHSVLANRITRWHLFRNTHFAMDIAALAAAWYTTTRLRVGLNPLSTVHMSSAAYRSIIPHPLLIVALWIAASLWLGSYRRKSALSAAHAFRQALESDVIACALAIVITFFSGASPEISRSFILLVGPLSLVYLGISFYLSVLLAMVFERRWAHPKRIAVVGEASEASSILGRLQNLAASSLQVTGLVLPERAVAVAGTNCSLPVLGTVGQLAAVINRERLDQVICVSNTPGDFELCSAISHRMGVTVSRPLAADRPNVRLAVNRDYGLSLIDEEPLQFTHRQYLVKRAVDVIASSLLLLLLAPLLIVLAILIRLTSPGPIFFKSQRVGKGGRHFTFWKFRSMYVDGPPREILAARNERNGHLFKIRNDPRVTRLGRFMRRCSLDELPQLFNVLIGEMSLVGPRPLPAEDLDPDGLSSAHRQWAEHRTQVHPGITGIWQIRGRSDLSFEQMVELDLHYIANWSLMLDIQILLETPLAVFSGRGAY